MSTSTEYEFTDYEMVAIEINTKKIAKNLLNEGISIDIVSRVTELRIEDIKKL